MTSVLTSGARAGVLVAAACVDGFSNDFFEPALAGRDGLIAGTAPGRGTALFLNAGGEQWVLRHYFRGGLVGRVNHDCYLWLGEARTRSFAEWRLLENLQQRGLPVPVPVAARYQRHGIFYTADIITRRLEGARTWSGQLAEAGGDSPAHEWHAVGACLRRFHDAGVYHADLNAHNIMLDGNGKVYLLDFDRGAIRAPGRWQQATLERLQRSLRKINAQCSTSFYTEARWAQLLQGYAQSSRTAR